MTKSQVSGRKSRGVDTCDWFDDGAASAAWHNTPS
jgi:hypothetical protein